MSYDVFISYEISDSSLAYELAAVLSRNSVTYYLDCVNSSVALSDYVKELFTNSRLFIPLVNTRYLQEGYARNLLSYAVGIGKQVLVCNTDDCALPAEMGWGIPEKNRINVCDCDVDAIVQDEVLRLLNQSENDGAVGPQNISLATAIEDVPIVDSELETVLIDEEKKRLLAEMLYALRVHKEMEEGVLQNVKPEPSKTQFKKEEKEKTFKEKVMDVILFPYRCVFALVFLFFIYFVKSPILTIAIIFCLIKCGCDDAKVSTTTQRQEFTKEQIAQGEQLTKVGSNYYYGRNGVEKNRVKALEYYKQAAELGNVEAIYNVGMCAKLGQGCQKDSVTASYYFYQAAQKDYELSFEELKALAEAGIPEAQNRLGICYKQGHATKIVEKNAAYWYHQAAKQGNPYAQYNLGMCYNDGKGVKQNTQEALEWFKLSAQQGHEHAMKMVDKIEEDEKKLKELQDIRELYNKKE